jgi:hypothetical protein
MVSLDPVAVNPAHKMPLFVYLSGCDGAGKTTQAQALLTALEQAGQPAERLWLRFPFFFSLPFLVYARLRGLSWYERDGDNRQGYWDFRLSWLMREVFPYIYWLDAWLALVVRVLLPRAAGRAFVCERFVLDMVVDLSVALHNLDFFATRPGNLLLGLLPKEARVFVLDADAATIFKRRPQMASDRNLAMKLRVYRKIAAARGFNLLSTHAPVPEVVERILREVMDGQH